jgi:hypothetical protein
LERSYIACVRALVRKSDCTVEGMRV